MIGNQFNVPGGLAFDAAGRLYVTDDGVTGLPGRVLVFTPPFQPGGMSATRIMGVFSPSNPPPSNARFQETVMGSPTGVFFFPDQSVGVTDSQSHRILVFPPYPQWPDPNTSYSPQAAAFFGQTSFAESRAERRCDVHDRNAAAIRQYGGRSHQRLLPAEPPMSCTWRIPSTTA